MSKRLLWVEGEFSIFSPTIHILSIYWLCGVSLIFWFVENLTHRLAGLWWFFAMIFAHCIIEKAIFITLTRFFTEIKRWTSPSLLMILQQKSMKIEQKMKWILRSSKSSEGRDDWVHFFGISFKSNLDHLWMLC